MAFNERTSADDDVTSCVVNFEDFSLDDTANEVADITWSANIYLATGQEYIYTDIDQKPALDFANNCTGDNLTFTDLTDDFFPIR